VRTKPQVILDFTSGDLKFQSITTGDVQVRVYGNTAVETGRSTMIGQDKGQTVPRDTRFTRVCKTARALAVDCQPLLVPDCAPISSHTKCLTNRWSQPLTVAISTLIS
jgi:ketosteroid isomerase-like protein